LSTITRIVGSTAQDGGGQDQVRLRIVAGSISFDFDLYEEAETAPLLDALRSLSGFDGAAFSRLVGHENTGLRGSFQTRFTLLAR
jgi:hypothetical protein